MIANDGADPAPPGPPNRSAARAAAGFGGGVRAISLDLDDTLWPVRPTLVRAERELHDWLAPRAPRAAALMTSPARAEIRATVLATHPERAHDVGFVRQQAIRLALQRTDGDESLADAAFDVFLAARQRVAIYPDVRPVLARWARRYPIVAITNGNADVGRVGLGHFFAATVSAQACGFAKPDPRIFARACAAVGAAPGEVLHVGDDLNADVVAALRAGLRAAWLRRPDLTADQDARHAASDATGAPSLPPAFASLAEIDAHLHDRA